MKKLVFFLFIKGAEFIFLKKTNSYTFLFYFIFSIFIRLEYQILKTFILVSLFFFVIGFYFTFFVFVFKSDKFASFSCEQLKANLEPKVFNSLVGNLPFHEFIVTFGGSSVKLLVKATGGHVILAGGGLVVADHFFHETGVKALLDTKIHLASEQLKYDFSVKNGTTYNPGASPSLTKSLLKTLAEKAAK